MHHGTAPSDASSPGFELSLANEQSAHAVDEDRLVAAARRVLADSPWTSARISLAVVDDQTIHALNRRFLDHDYPTDVLSFLLHQQHDHLEGEVIASAQTAAANAHEFGWSAADELLLYVIHGMLHLVGHDDKMPAQIGAMREAEARYLRACGVEPPREGAPPGPGHDANFSLQPDRRSNLL